MLASRPLASPPKLTKTSAAIYLPFNQRRRRRDQDRRRQTLRTEPTGRTPSTKSLARKRRHLDHSPTVLRIPAANRPHAPGGNLDHALAMRSRRGEFNVGAVVIRIVIVAAAGARVRRD